LDTEQDTPAEPRVSAEVGPGGTRLTAGVFSLGVGGPALTVDGQSLPLSRDGTGVWSGEGLELTQTLVSEGPSRLRWGNSLRNVGAEPRVLNRVVLFESNELELGPRPEEARVLEQNANLGRVRTPRQMLTGSDGLAALDRSSGAFVSQTHTVFYNSHARQALLLGVETINAWMPTFEGRMSDHASVADIVTGMDNVDAGAGDLGAPGSGESSGEVEVPRFRAFRIAFDAGDYRLDPGEEIALGDVSVEVGTDPLALLEAYGRRVKAANALPDAPAPFANWCSWYPYRLVVTQEHVAANARIARQRRLGELGLRYVQVDLGWEVDNIPTYFEENERFPDGFAALSGQLRELGFKLGAWVGVLCVADSHPIASEHPEWLLRGDDGDPLATSTWFWTPHSPIYGLDVSHPGAQQWLRDGFTRLARDGVRYLKFDFAGVVANPRLRGRSDPKFVTAGSRQGVRAALQIAQTALESADDDAMMIDCSGTDYAGAGVTGVSYVVMDTGNTGLGWGWLREVYTSYACHLFKRQWALLQPSCLVVGPPGTLEEARLRATITFMGAGHVDIGDDLTTLPPDRWPVLLATLPPNDTAARPIDLFEPVATGDLRFLDPARSAEREPRVRPDPQGASVWVLPVDAGWDQWVLVAFANWTDEGTEVFNAGRRWRVPVERLGLSPDEDYWGYEFWSGQFLGDVPRPQQPADAYRHNGDFINPVLESPAGTLEVGFYGPAVKLLVIRRRRPHPWPVGTSFHQSGGRELSDVRWDPDSGTLSGNLRRPPGETGYITIAGTPGDTGAHVLHLTTESDVTPWSVTFD
jgi:hypothetical protein